MRTLHPFVLCILWLITGILTAHLAEQRGRSYRFWFLAGTCLGLFALLFLFALPKSVVRRVVAEGPSKEGAALSVANGATAHPRESLTSKEWFFLDKEHHQCGPAALRFLQAQWADQKIDAQTYVWCEGMEEWKRIGELPILFDKMQG